ncbi:MAG: hypothetical protein JRG89_19910 [Deltaproteobacteria bacterium]|nr:hypothetical protein [Deltaproteobacteria bacterium]
MSLPLALTVKHEGRSIQLTLTRCKVFMASEFAGNVDLHIDCDLSLEPIVQESLHLRVPGEDTSVEFIASGGPDDGVMLVFHCEAIALLANLPESLDFLWCGEPMASVTPELAESVPIEQVQTLVDPLEILGQPAMRTSDPFCLGVERGWIWLLPAVLLCGFGAAGCFGELAGVQAERDSICSARKLLAARPRRRHRRVRLSAAESPGLVRPHSA